MKRFSVAICLTAGLYASMVASQSPAPFPERLEQARTAWQTAGFANYVYGYNKFCECHAESPPETLVTIEQGVVTDVRHLMAKTGDTVSADADKFSLYWTVDDLFALLERAVESAETVQADFDADNGVPQRIFIDYLPDLIGDEVDVRVTQFSAR